MIMNMRACLSQVILLASLKVLVRTDQSQFVFNLKDVVDKYAKDYAASKGTTVWFADMFAEHEEMRKRSVYRRYRVHVTASAIKFGEPIGGQRRPSEVHTQTITNEGTSSDTISTVTHSCERTESTSLKTYRGFQINYTSSVKAGVPGIGSVGGDYSLDYTLGKTDLDTKTKTETLQISVEVRVPPQRTVQVSWYIADTVMDFPWTAEVTVRGWFAFWLRKPFNGHNLWFHSVAALASIDSNLTYAGPQEVTFQAEGVFRKVSTYDSRVFVYEINKKEAPKPAKRERKKKAEKPPVME